MPCNGHNSQCSRVAWPGAQDILAQGHQERDASGNPILKDVGLWMRNEIKCHFKDADIKYIDPSYMIRSTPTISADRIYCKVGEACAGAQAVLLVIQAAVVRTSSSHGTCS